MDANSREVTCLQLPSAGLSQIVCTWASISRQRGSGSFFLVRLNLGYAFGVSTAEVYPAEYGSSSPLRAPASASTMSARNWGCSS